MLICTETHEKKQKETQCTIFCSKSYEDALKIIYDACSINLANFFILNNQSKLRKEIGNVSKRQQPDHRADNSRRPPMGLLCSEKIPHPEASFNWPLKKICILVQ